ncbi:ATP-binding cassette domain-containing protein [Brevibacterium gallinarum]|uniref:ATP-binding cassette domain-containing protein n=1 Tax=Brevibacterium gallinarum TaxID=2762220 RepID=A0ABR8WXZ2_9MICO|nr:ATP-binding cassette domain-containing protein [Brevibacterium gallinarum]MBD8021953.1 ATP-binding cassette domain-containing protein [Brevibacterium gallinarum]
MSIVLAISTPACVTAALLSPDTIQELNVNSPNHNSILEITGLNVGFQNDASIAPAVENVSLSVERGEVLAVVGESGSGKSITAMSVLVSRVRLSGRAVM